MATKKSSSKPASPKARKGPAAEAGFAKSKAPVDKSSQPNPSTDLVKESAMSKNTTTTPAVSTEGSVDFKALATKGFTVLNTRVSDVTPTSVMDKMPTGVKTAAGYTPVSVLVGLAAYGLYRKFFKKTPNTNA